MMSLYQPMPRILCSLVHAPLRQPSYRQYHRRLLLLLTFSTSLRPLLPHLSYCSSAQSASAQSVYSHSPMSSSAQQTGMESQPRSDTSECELSGAEVEEEEEEWLPDGERDDGTRRKRRRVRRETDNSNSALHQQPPLSCSSFSPHTCPHCSVSFLDAYCLRRHAKEVHGDRRFDCPRCGARLRDRYDLRQHINKQAHHAPSNDESDCSNSDNGREDDGGSREHRTQSEDEFVHNPSQPSSSSALSTSASSSSSPASAAAVGDSALLDALVTVSAAIPRPQLQQHAQQPVKKKRASPVRQSTCSICNKSFKGGALLANHMRVHTREQPFACDFPGCSKRFTERSNLTKHSRAHTLEQPFKCPHEGCGRAFTVKCNLQTHIRKHTNDYPFVCDWAECGKRFTHISDMRKHSRRHTARDSKGGASEAGKKSRESQDN